MQAGRFYPYPGLPTMHELALARSLIELVDAYSVENGCRPVRRIHVRLGVMSAMTRALHFCFGSVSRGTCCESAILEIEEIPLTVNCHYCDGVKTPSGRYNFRCPDCGRPTPNVVTGREMQLTSIELVSDTIRDASSNVHQHGPSSSDDKPGDKHVA